MIVYNIKPPFKQDTYTCESKCPIFPTSVRLDVLMMQENL